MSETTENKFHYLAALLLGVVGLLVILIFVSLRSGAADQGGTASTSISNAAPSIGSIALTVGGNGLSDEGNYSPTIGPDNTTADSDNTIVVTVPFTDNNSCNEVYEGTGDWSVALKLTGATCAEAANNDAGNTCFYADQDSSTGDQRSCVIEDCSGADDTAANIVCTFTARHYTDPGVWVLSTLVDDSTTNDGDTDYNFTVNGTTGLTLAGTSGLLDFGALGLGATSTGQNLVVRDIGNQDITVTATNTLFSCTKEDNGSFHASDEGVGLHVSTTDAAYASLGLTSALSAALSEQESETRTDSTHFDTLNWGIGVPSKGVAGVCTSVITLTGTAS